MSPAALVLLAALQAAGAPGSAPEASAWVEPERVAIGEPFTLALDVLAGPDERVLLDPPAAEPEGFGLGFAVVEPRRVVRLDAGDGSGRVLTQARWRLFALEPGRLALTTPGADVLHGGSARRVEAREATIEVEPALAEGEDAPRPLAGFREPPPPAPRRWRGLLAGGAALLGLALVGGVGALALRGRGRALAPAPPTPAERLARLDADDDAARQDLHRELARCVREALDAAAGVRLAGCTDEEWAARQRELGRVPVPALERAAGLLAACGEVRYAGASATRFAAEERLAEARALCAEAAAAGEEVA